MYIRRGLDTGLTISAVGVSSDFIDTTRVRFSIVQGDYRVYRENSDVVITYTSLTTTTNFSVSIDPDETLGFDASPGAPQTKAIVKWAETDGQIFQTEVTPVQILDTIDEETI